MGIKVLLFVLTIIFITLKLTGIVNWSWIWVFAPIWLPLTLYLVLFIIAHTITLSIVLVLVLIAFSARPWLEDKNESIKNGE